MRGGKQLARRFSPERVFLAVGRAQTVGRIGLPALELLDLRDPEAEKFLERRDVDPVAFLDGLGTDKLLEHAGKSLPQVQSLPPQRREIRAPRSAQLFRVPRPRHQARDARPGGGARDPRAAGQGAARRMARARLQGAVRVRAERLGAVRVRRRRQGADESGKLLLPAAEHPPPRAQPLARPRDDRGRLPRELQDGVFGETCSQKVTGPSFTRLTCMWAPKRPVATRGSHSSAFSTKRLNKRSADSAPAALEKLGRAPLLVSAASVNCGTASSWPFTSLSERFIFPSLSGKMR